MANTLQIILTIVILGLLARIIVTDFLRYKIHNVDVLALLAVSLGLLMTGGWKWPLSNVAAGTVLFALGVVFWQLKWIGAGDAKLLGACGFMAGLQHLFTLSLLTLVFSVVFLGAIRLMLPMPMLPARLYERLSVIIMERKIPYGVPLALAMAVIVFRGAT